MQRFRVHYAKNEGLRYTGNLDIHRIWERSLRRAGLNVTYSQGFHPQVRIQQGCPLPLGFLSTVEIIDIWLNDDNIMPEMILEVLQTAVPNGLELQTVIPVADVYEKALMGRTQTVQYDALILCVISLEEIHSRIENLLLSSNLPRERRNKQYDLRPLIVDLTTVGEDPVIIRMNLTAREGATGRPEEVLEQLQIDPMQARITRTGIEFA